ncbi:alpha/beta fold hydrolase [Nocardia sp. CA-107356]|uniref:alpha/beta fold hydrolase n=1 Tax=Nocardia sp. CA-107356 TaxID=3239972 RepID=UPI003D90A5CE
MSGEPLVLLHGVAMSGRVWDPLIPALSARYRVLAPTALGHRGGASVSRRPARIADFVDEVEQLLDEHGWSTAHLVGNSLGGWTAVELARRGRARTVCAFSPAGFWHAGGTGHADSSAEIARNVTFARLTRPLAPLTLRAPLLRRMAFRVIAEHGDRLGPAAAEGIVADLLACTVTDDLLGTGDQIADFAPLPCPITVAWSQADRIFPVAVNGAIARQRLPDATFEILPGVGHVPMIDNPDLVLHTILTCTGAAPEPGHQAPTS